MKPSKRLSTVEPPRNPFQEKGAALARTARRRAQREPPRTRNVFADQRIAEDDPNLPEEDRYLARLQRERTRRTRRRARFSLADDQGDDVLPDPRPASSLLYDDYEQGERAQTLSGLSEGDVDGDGSDDELLTVKESVKENREDEGDEGMVRSHQEIMDEVVLKSKMHKAQRQHEKHAVDEQTAKLDEDLPQIMALLSKSTASQELKQADETSYTFGTDTPSIFTDDVLANRVNESENRDLELHTPAENSAFHYEKVYYQLAAEKRARPSDRLLTGEEKAEKEMQELLSLEAKRKRRMQSVDSEVESDDAGPKRSKHRSLKRKQKRSKTRSGGDDLHDGFDLPESDSESNSDSLPMNQSDLEDVPERLVEGDVKQQRKLKKNVGKDGHLATSTGLYLDPNLMLCRKTYAITALDSEIPFVFKECPTDCKQLQAVFEGKTIDQRGLVLERLQKCFAISLNPAVNSTKLEGLLRSVLEIITSLSKVDIENTEAAVKEMDMLLKHVHSLGAKKEDVVCSWARSKVADAFTSLTSEDGEKEFSALWNTSLLLVLRCIGRLFPGSDIRHPVCTPLVLLLSEGLEVCRMKSVEDVATGLFVGNILLEQMVESGRYSGQLTRFLIAVIEGVYGGRKCVALKFLQQRIGDDGSVREDGVGSSKLRISECARGLKSAEESRLLASKVGRVAVSLIEASGFGGRIKHMDIVFDSLALDRVPRSKARSEVEVGMREAQRLRKALTLYAKCCGVVRGKSINPKFSAEGGVFRKQARTSYTARRNGDISGSATRVRRALRKEERAMARDVRQGAFDAAQNDAEVEEERLERRDKRGREAMAFLEDQQATWKRAEKRQRMLSGKKW